jgi:hypothetical protein
VKGKRSREEAQIDSNYAEPIKGEHRNRVNDLLIMQSEQSTNKRFKVSNDNKETKVEEQKLSSKPLVQTEQQAPHEEKPAAQLEQARPDNDTIWAKINFITSAQRDQVVQSKLRIKGCEYRIGRNSQNDLQIMNQVISGCHAIIRRRECPSTGKMLVEITDYSANGTYVNGELVSIDGHLLRSGR